MAHPMTEFSDESHVNAVRAGDVQAFNRLVQRYFGTVYAIAYVRLKHRETAEDLAQEVFLRVFLYIDQVKEPASFSAWIGQITRNLACAWLRQHQNKSTLLAAVPLENWEESIPDPHDAGPRREAEVKEEAQTVRDAILQLPPEQAEIVLLHFGEDLKLPEIARRLGVHPTTVRRHIKKALTAMRGSLEPIVRDSVSTLRSSPTASRRAIGAVAAATAMSATAKATLIEMAGGAVWVASLAPAASGAAVATTGFSTLLKTITAAFAAGGKMMITGKGIAVLMSLAVLLAGGFIAIHSDGNAQTETEQLMAKMVDAYKNTDTYLAETSIHIVQTPNSPLSEEEVKKEERARELLAFDRSHGRIRAESWADYQNMQGDTIPDAMTLLIVVDEDRAWYRDPRLSIDHHVEARMTKPLDYEQITKTAKLLRAYPTSPVLASLLGVDLFGEIEKIMGESLQITVDLKIDAVAPRADDTLGRPGLRITGWPDRFANKLDVITYWIDPKANLITQYTIEPKSRAYAAVVDYKIQKHNEPLDASQFVFDAPRSTAIESFKTLR